MTNDKNPNPRKCVSTHVNIPIQLADAIRDWIADRKTGGRYTVSRFFREAAAAKLRDKSLAETVPAGRPRSDAISNS